MANNYEPQKKSDIFIIRGDTTAITFTLTGYDLTGSTVFFTAKPALTDDAADANAVITKEVTSHSDPTNGITIIDLDSTDTDVTPGTYYYDVQIKDSSGTITSIPARKLTIYADVTRRTT